jgi:deoxyribodipyrimidine photo-lyase
MSKPYNLKYDDTIEWATDDDEAKLDAWKQGKTGFPIVDAAMRSLNAQGYMHNRCRMIVASFLCKVSAAEERASSSSSSVRNDSELFQRWSGWPRDADPAHSTQDLLIDWRRGEKYFMQMLVDGDVRLPVLPLPPALSSFFLASSSSFCLLARD